MEPFVKLLKNCDVYAPKHIGMRNILIGGERIILIEEELSHFAPFRGPAVFDMHGARVCPGLIDMHVHVTGGGGEQGPVSRTPEIRASEVFLSGVTTLVGLLGTDGVSRSLENLLFKCRALEEEGISTLMLTGNYRYPSPTLTGDVERDITLIDKIIGVKIAVSDHRSSNITVEELIRLGTQARVAGLIAGKPGLVVMHMGSSPKGLQPLFDALETSDIPVGNFLPTHVGRRRELTEDAVRFNKMGGTVDFTAADAASVDGTAVKIAGALEQGADAGRITVSSDGCGSQPKFDEHGVCIGLTYSLPNTLLLEVRRMSERFGIPLETALAFLSENPARVLGLSGRKGVIAPGADADILVLDGEYKVKMLFAKGKLAVADGNAVMKGRFE